MPGCNGAPPASTAPTPTASGRLPGLPVVLTSGYSHVLAQEGTHGFELLHKPYSVEGLSRALERATGARQEGR